MDTPSARTIRDAALNNLSAEMRILRGQFDRFCNDVRERLEEADNGL